MELFNILPLIVLLALIWLTYLNINFAATIIKTKKKDSTLQSCQSKAGNIFYLVLTIIYALLYLGCLVYSIMVYLDSGLGNDIYMALNIIALFSLFASFMYQQIIYVGHRQMLIGKIILDYRKVKRVNYPKRTKLSFTYGQGQYNTYLWFIDDSKLKKALQKTR